MKLRSVTVVVLAAVLTATVGCEVAPYKERMQHLEDMAERGVEYRAELQKQGTAPSKEACEIGYHHLNNDPPNDDRMDADSLTWERQVEEAFVKSCMTGELKPKPDPSGVNAVKPSPFPSATKSS